MADNARATLLDMGMDGTDVNKAIKHFGPGIQIEAALDWILSGCPGYVEYAAPPAAPPNTQVVPYTGSNQQQQSTSLSNTGQSASPHYGGYVQSQPINNDGWLRAYEEHNNKNNATENDIASSMLALKQTNNAGNNNHSTASNTGNNNNRCRSDSTITQPGRSVWDIDESDIGRPYSKIPLPEDVPVPSNYGDSTNIPTIDLTDVDGNGNNSVGKGTSAPRTSPIDPALKSAFEDDPPPLQGPQEEVDPDLKRAIELSLQESAAKPAASTDMSRAASMSRAQQEEDELNQAMSQSMLYADQQASASFTKQQDEDNAKPRADLDVPVVLTTTSSFLAYLPSMIQTFYFNPTFRRMVLELDLDYMQSPSFQNYPSDAPTLTRSLLPPQTADCVVKLAALQRLFIFMSQSKRAKTGLTDVMDAFGIKVPNATRDRNPLGDMRGEFHPSYAYVRASRLTDCPSRISFP